MVKRCAQALLLSFSMLACTAGITLVHAAPPGASPAVTDISASRASAFSGPVVLRGSLGTQKVQVQLRPKSDDEGVEGDYFIFGQGQKILLAGELDAEDFWMEESVNGTDVSGQWQGQRDSKGLRGTWTSADDKLALPFALQIMTPGEAGKSVAGKAARRQ